MKQNHTYSLLTALALLMLTACSKKLEELYNDPDQITQPSIEQFFTTMLNNDRVRPSYWDIRTFVVMHSGIYTQSVGYLNNSTAYQQNPSYTEERWNDFYRPGANGSGVMAHYRSIEATYNTLNNQQKEEAAVFVQAARVVMLDQASQMVDLWGDIPFSEAGSLSASSEIVMARFDDAGDVYDTILNGLKNAADYFASAQLSSAAQAAFSRQDIMLWGNLDKWRRYTNSLRLRLLMRISYADETWAKNEVLTMLANPSLYPLADGNDGYSPATTDILLQPLTNFTGDLHNALYEITSYSAPGYLLNEVMKPVNDPRIPAMFDKYGRTVNDNFIPNTEYVGMPSTMPAEQQQVNLGNYAILDSATFLFNSKLPGIVITAPEVNFLKAEAWERWGGGDAAAAYETAINQSVIFYYYLNSLNTVTRTPLPAPGKTEMETFLQQAAVRYEGNATDKLAKIWTQKWIHFGFLQSVQNWSEYRRTKVPALTFYTSPLPGYELPPSRLLYPNSEAAYNEHYAEVKDKDTRTGKIFWDVK